MPVLGMASAGQFSVTPPSEVVSVPAVAWPGRGRREPDLGHRRRQRVGASDTQTVKFVMTLTGGSMPSSIVAVTV